MKVRRGFGDLPQLDRPLQQLEAFTALKALQRGKGICRCPRDYGERMMGIAISLRFTVEKGPCRSVQHSPLQGSRSREYAPASCNGTSACVTAPRSLTPSTGMSCEKYEFWQDSLATRWATAANQTSAPSPSAPLRQRDRSVPGYPPSTCLHLRITQRKGLHCSPRSATPSRNMGTVSLSVTLL